MTFDELEEQRTKYIPTWSQLRAIGNSRAVQASIIFPIIGYVIVLSSTLTSVIDGGLAGQASDHARDLWSRLWALKLYFVYFGLLNLGVGSALYQLRCPRQVKKHADWEDYIRLDGEAMHEKDIIALGKIIDRDYYGDMNSLVGSSEVLKSYYLREYFAIQSASKKYSRITVTIFFSLGLLLLSIPSAMTVIKIVKQLTLI